MQRIISAQEKNEDRGAWAERNCKFLGVEQTDWIKMKKKLQHWRRRSHEKNDDSRKLNGTIRTWSEPSTLWLYLLFRTQWIHVIKVTWNWWIRPSRETRTKKEEGAWRTVKWRKIIHEMKCKEIIIWSNTVCPTLHVYVWKEMYHSILENSILRAIGWVYHMCNAPWHLNVVYYLPRFTTKHKWSQ